MYIFIFLTVITIAIIGVLYSKSRGNDKFAEAAGLIGFGYLLINLGVLGFSTLATKSSSNIGLENSAPIALETFDGEKYYELDGKTVTYRTNGAFEQIYLSNVRFNTSSDFEVPSQVITYKIMQSLYSPNWNYVSFCSSQDEPYKVYQFTTLYNAETP